MGMQSIIFSRLTLLPYVINRLLLPSYGLPQKWRGLTSLMAEHSWKANLLLVQLGVA
jgi:hypothetical protein